MSIQKHIRECAEEMGIDWPIPTSRERKIRYRGRTIEVYFTEDGRLYAWKAFVMGLGESSGINESEAIDGAKKRIDNA